LSSSSSAFTVALEITQANINGIIVYIFFMASRTTNFVDSCATLRHFSKYCSCRSFYQLQHVSWNGCWECGVWW